MTIPRALLACAFVPLLAGCASMWGLAKIISDKPPIEEKSREQAVPLPGVSESLGVTLHLEGKPLAPAATIPDPVIECVVVQTGREEVYHAATYYGRTWKWLTGVSFLIEGTLGAVYFLAGDSTTEYVVGAYWAADALVTGALFFAPSRSSYEHVERDASLRVRDDCPAGLVIEVAGRPVPVDADGHLGALALALLARHVTTTPEPIRVRLGAFSGEIHVDAAVRCSWARRRSLPAAVELCKLAGAQATSTRADRASLSVAIEVPLGLLTSGP